MFRKKWFYFNQPSAAKDRGEWQTFKDAVQVASEDTNMKDALAGTVGIVFV